MSDVDTSVEDELRVKFARLFDTPLGREVLQHILVVGGVFEAPDDMPAHELAIAHGTRALALDIANLAGLMPAVPKGDVRIEKPTALPAYAEGNT